MTDRPTVSVVIPTLNRADELPSAIASVLGSGAENIEIIVVDDGSSDGTDNLDFAGIDRRIRFVRHATNLGGSAARNSGIDAARAPLVAFLDSDDRWLPGKLARQLDFIDGRTADDRFIAGANIYLVKGESRMLHNARPPRPDEDLSEYLMVARLAIQTSTMLLPTTLAREVRFRVGLRRHQDWDFLLRVVASGAKLIYDDQPAADYNLRHDPNRVTAQRHRALATLEWYKLAGALASPRAKRVYFVRSLLGKDAAKEPWAAMKGLAWLSAQSPLAAPSVVATILSEGARKLVGHAGR